MTLSELRDTLARHPNTALHIMLPDGSFVPSHFHVTEVGYVRKDFIDCGGTVRSTSACVLQVWVANDLDHRLDSSRLDHILSLATPVLNGANPPVEIEYEQGVVSQYPLNNLEVTPSGLLFDLATKHTACLAPELCGTVESRSCCGTDGCC